MITILQFYGNKGTTAYLHRQPSCVTHRDETLENRESRTRGLERGAVDKLLVGIFVFHGEKDKENLSFNLAVGISALLTN